MKSKSEGGTTKIALVGNYLPRQCGIATFTTDLCETLASEYPQTEFMAAVMVDRPEGYDFPGRVRFELVQEDLSSYENAAEFLNLQEVDMVCLQHEFGIYGGKAGSHILTFLRGLTVPVVTTLHTVLNDPDEDQRAVMAELISLSDRLVVMSQRAVQFLQDVYEVPRHRIDLIPHGIPDVPFVEPELLKDKFNFGGKRILLTFGLLSPNKGLEYVLEAMPSILEQYPDVVYLALGATHPRVKEQQGEEYRQSLKELARKLNVEKNVIFEDRFVNQTELMDFIEATDIYITPYLNPAQIVSGTLAYTIGAGKAVISTPYWYAEELLADDRGLLVPFRDSKAIAAGVVDLFGNDAQCQAMRKRAYLYGRNMIWSKVAQKYMSTFEKARARRIESPEANWAMVSQVEPASGKWSSELPPINLKHVFHLTDSTGILQHAIYDLPNYAEGYCTDDNARALLLSIILDKLDGDRFVDTRGLSSRYLAFLWYAFNQKKGRFRNFLSFDRRWLDEIGSEDSHARALWALGCVLGHANSEGLMGVAARLFDQALPATLQMGSPRSWAFTLLGISEYLHRFPGDRTVTQMGETLGERLLQQYRQTRRPDWYWFEQIVSYNNATLPHALLLSGSWMEQNEVVETALESLQWLIDQQSSLYRHFMPVGSNGFYQQGGTKARFDQQPIEASAMVSACLDAYRISGDQHWYRQARIAFEWFLGRNDLGVSVYDAETGGCHDGLQIDGLNQNQGAESTLAYLLALTEMYLIRALTPIEDDSKQKYPLLLNRRSGSD
jgi:glycosyltransferase involved in cell wall biosynthesis